MTTMRTPKQERGFGKGDSEGSALLLTLLATSLLLLLTLAFVAMVRLEMRQVTEYQRHQLAQANARLGANLALAELQRTLGPDTAVSARADILSTANPENPETGVSPFQAHESKRFWTGAWSSGQESLGGAAFRPYKGNRQGRFDSWLVSLPPARRRDILEVGGPIVPAPNQNVALAHIHAVPLAGGAPQRHPVLATLQTSANQKAYYAWWVSDEGVKANLTLTDPNLGQSQSGVGDISRLLFPHRENFAATRWFGATEWDDEAFIERIQKLGAGTQSPWLAVREANLSPEAALVLGGAPGVPAASLLADYTLHSLGVLSNNKKGGLRKDLSLAFWRDPREPLFPANSTQFTRNMGYNRDFSDRISIHGRIFNQEDYPDNTVRSSTSRSFFGPQWDVLRDFHNSFQKLDNPGAANPAAFFELVRTSDDPNRNSRGMFGGLNEQDSLHRVGRHVTRDQVLRPISGAGAPNTVRVNGFANNSIHPLVASAEFFLTFDLVPAGLGGSGQPVFGPRLNLFVVANLWNPHNVALSTRTLSGASAISFTINVHFGQMSFQVRNTTTGEEKSILLAELIDQQAYTGGLNQNIRALDFTIPMHPSGINFLPGEVRQFRLSAGNQLAPEFSETAMSFPMNTIPPKAMTFEEGQGMRVVMNVDDILNSQISGNFRLDFQGSMPGLATDLQMFRFGGILRDALDVYEDFGMVGPDGLEGDPLVLGTIQHVLKAANEPEYGVPNLLAHFTPRAVYPGGALITNYTATQPPNYFSRVARTSVLDVPAVRDGSLVRGFWGNSRSLGSSFVPLFDVPRRPPESLGQYQHAALSIFGSQPAYALGNSLAHPHVGREWAHDLGGANNASQIDLSWFLNDAIWDDFFLSTLDPDDTANPSVPQRERFVPLDPARAFGVSNPDDYKLVASNLLLQGAFNVNSTSVEAWTAILSSLGGPSSAGDLAFPFHRFSKPTGSPNSAWTGAPRDLTETQIRRLAEEMVAQVRARGPFLSLSDFVNRRLVDDGRGAMGAIQAAIRAANLNSVVPVSAASSAGAPVSAHVLANAAAMAPGDLSQADVLTTIGPKMSARSDTFVIRSYGQYRESADGSVLSEAWAEMLVQRFPGEHPESAFGRNFRILNFKYLNPDEI